MKDSQKTLLMAFTAFTLLSLGVSLWQVAASQWIVFVLLMQLLTGASALVLMRKDASSALATLESAHNDINTVTRQRDKVDYAIEHLSGNLMMADNDLNITSVNRSLMAMLASRQDAIRQQIPSFNVATLVGTNIDTFHKNPHHQRQLLSNLTTQFETTIEVGGLSFGLIVTPLKTARGESEGFTVEWQDLTAELARQQQQKENTRLQVALDNVNTNVMLADNEFNIIYLNKSLKQMMKTNIDTFRILQTDFDPEKLIGVCIDTFHKDPSHQRALLDRLTATYETTISLGEMAFSLTATPVVDKSGERIGTTLEWADITELKRQQAEAKENARIRSALDGVTTNVMVADDNLNIVYLNASVERMLADAEQDLRKELPHFNANNLIGQNIDQFHKNPSHQRSMLAKLESTYRTKIAVGRRQFTLIASPVFDNERNRLGTVVEWADITAQVETEQEVEKLVSSVAQGNLGALIATDNKEGFFLNIANGLNELSQTVNAFVRDINTSLQQVSEGDMRVQISNDYQGMFDEVKGGLNDTTQRLNSVISTIKVSADSIRSANHELSLGNDQLSERTEKQASNLEETAASLEELTGNVRSTADNASTANSAAEKARKLAREGEDIVSNAVVSMSEITDSSNKISAIIGVIDEIAFQTNLLALNASVEAARAGEHGRGFAVVANEVRNLAQRSATSAKEIKELIDDSSEKVSTGSDLVNRCGESLKEILGNVDQLSSLISEIDSATNEQASGIAQVNQAVAELDDITQQNAALAEEASSASQSSVQQVDEMVQQIGFFQVTDQSGHMAPSRPAAHAPASKPKVTLSAGASPKPMSTKMPQTNDEEWEEF